MAVDWYKYLGVSHFFLYFEAFVVWVAGILACAEISSKLFFEIYRSDTSSNNTYLIVGLLLGAILGLVQAYFIFFRVCRRNLDRILQLEQPLFFNCYRISFYIFFGIFDTTMVIVSDRFATTTMAKTVMAVLDMSVSIGLFLSLWVYKEYWTQFRSKNSNTESESKEDTYKPRESLIGERV